MKPRTPIEIGEEYRIRFLPKCWEETDRLVRRRLRTAVVWLVAFWLTGVLVGFLLGVALTL